MVDKSLNSIQKGVSIMLNFFYEELKELIRIILTDENTKKELESIDNLNQIYNIFKNNGFSGNYNDFKKSISKIFKISEEELEKISGGIITNPSLKKLIATTMSSFALTGTSMTNLNAIENSADTSSYSGENFFSSNDSLKFKEDFDINNTQKKNKDDTLGKKIRLNFSPTKTTSTEVKFESEIYKQLYNCISSKLNENEINNLESVLPDNDLINVNYDQWKREMCKGLKVKYESLNSLVSEVINSKGNKDIQNIIMISLCRDSNIYDIQKRFIFSVILNELNKNNSDFYQAYFEMGEKVNKEILVSALTDQAKSQAAKSIMHVMLMAQIGELEINRKPNMMPAKEYISSIFKYGESILIRHPLSISQNNAQDLRKALYPGRGTDNTWAKRISSHGAKITQEKVIEEKYAGLNAITNAPYAFITANNQGIGINISRKDSKLNTAGHLLVYNTENEIGEASLVKLESSGPGETSVFGHGHGANVKSNKISAACQIKALSEHIPRNAVHIDMRGVSSEKLIELIENFDDWIDKNATDEASMKEMLNKLSGRKLSLDKLENFISQYAPNSSWNDGDYRFCAKGKHITSKELIDISAPEEMKNFGIRIFDDSNGNYMYYIEDEAELREIFDSNEAAKIISSQFQWMKLTDNSGYLKSREGMINPYLAKQIKENKIKTLNYETFLSKAINEQWVKDKMLKARHEHAKLIKIPGIQFYRSKKSSWNISYTVYGYIITDLQEFKNYAKQNMQMNEREIQSVIENQNLWMWTTGYSGPNINNLPTKFKNALNVLKDAHTFYSKKSGYKDDELVIEIHPGNVINNKIIRNTRD